MRTTSSADRHVARLTKKLEAVADNPELRNILEALLDVAKEARGWKNKRAAATLVFNFDHAGHVTGMVIEGRTTRWKSKDW